MPLSVAAHNLMLDTLGTNADFVGLILATQLAAAVAAGASTVTTDHAVAIGDYVSLNDGANREVFEAINVTGSGPFTVTLGNANGSGAAATTVNAYGDNTYVGHAPKASAQLREVTGGSYARQAITWNAAASENLDNIGTQSFAVPAGAAIGGYMLSDLASAGAYYGSALTNSIEVFGSAGTYDLTDADVSLSS